MQAAEEERSCRVASGPQLPGSPVQTPVKLKEQRHQQDLRVTGQTMQLRLFVVHKSDKSYFRLCRPIGYAKYLAVGRSGFGGPENPRAADRGGGG